MAEFGPVSLEVAGVQLSHDSVTVPGGDLRACSEPKPVSWREGEEGEDYSIEGTAVMIQTSLKCVHTHTNCSSSSQASYWLTEPILFKDARLKREES